MEIPRNVQDKLKCSECDEFLSCGPVYLLHGTNRSICGRCSQQFEKDKSKSNDKTRNEQYEAIASLVEFPCAFAGKGCPKKVKFSLRQPPHESNCEFRPFICPIAPRGACQWIGSRSQLKNHCNEKHALNFFENPCNPPRPNLTASNLQTYLISAFNFLFLLHIKVCVSSGKLFHSLLMFGEEKFLKKFSYTLEIEGNNKKITEYGSVLRAGILTIQEANAICTTINSLLDFLGGKYNESIFTIRIHSSLDLCLNCSSTIEDISSLKFCRRCEANLLKCEFHYQGCSFTDVNSDKIMKHEWNFCQYQTMCCLRDCGKYLNGASIFDHYCSNTCRITIKSNIDSVVRITRNSRFNSNVKYILFATNYIGTVVCTYKLINNLELFLRTSLPSYELKNYKCTIKLTDPFTRCTLTLTPDINYSDWNDWEIVTDIDKFPSFRKLGIDLKINIDKI